MISLIGMISVLGVALGVASLIIVLSVMNGFDREVKEKIIGTYAHIVVTRDGGVSDPEELITKVRMVPGVVSASPFITGQAVIHKGEEVSGILLKGVDPASEREVSQVISFAGTGGARLGGDTIVPGSELMRDMYIREGDIVEVMVPYSAMDLEKRLLKVTGGFTSGRYDYDSNIAVVGLETARKLFRMDGAVTGVGLRVADAMDVAEVKSRINSVLGHRYNVKSWMDLDRNLVTALALEKKMMFIILGLVVMVACFNICGSLIMMVMEKTRDIGILKAIGATSLGVRLVFLLEGMMIGLLGIVFGGLAGVFIARRVNAVAGLVEQLTGITVFPSDVYYFTRIPVMVSPADVIMVIALAFALTVAAGIYPAWKASRLDPVEAIRYE